MVKLKYVGPFAEVEVAGQTVRRNHQFEVSDEDAGHPPVPRLADAMVELRAAVDRIDHVEAAKLRDEIATIDMGDGLLAQPDNYQPATPAKKKDGEGE